ncbi:MAG: hypothetical protein IBJ03_03525 [Gemmatimonadaceae bacterium]|nr:hypothetical protein [Gemmatimonadaceae bacterium]
MTSRERKVVLGGVLILGVALLMARVVMPLANRWLDRESRIQSLADRLDRLNQLVLDSSSYTADAANAERVLSEVPRRVLQARTVSLGASQLQSMLQGTADGARLAVNRIAVEPDTDSLERLQATISAYGDIFGLAEVLGLIERGPRAMSVRRLVVQQNSALRGAPDLLSLSIQVAAPLLVDGTVPPLPAGSSQYAFQAPSPTGLEAQAHGSLVMGNLFSASRVRPRERFVLPGQELAIAEERPADATSNEADATPRLTLVGIVGEGNLRAALLDAGTADAAKLVRVGDRFAGFVVRRIDATSVQLTRSGQQVTLKLSRSSSRDSSTYDS